MVTEQISAQNRKNTQWVEKRLADSGSLLSVPGLIAGSQSSQTVNKKELEKCPYKTFSDFCMAMVAHQKDSETYQTSMTDGFYEVK